MNKNELTDYFDSVTPNHVQKQKMLRIILNSRKDETRATKRFSLAAAVMVLCVLTATTALAINLGWSEKLMEYLKPSEEQMDKLSGAVNIPEAMITKNDVTITIKQTLADSFGIYVLYEMTVPKDIELNNNIQWRDSHLDVPIERTNGVGIGSESTEILGQTGNKRTVLLHQQFSKPIENGDIELVLYDLGYFEVTGGPGGNAKFVPLVEGKWDLSWKFNYVDTSKTIEVNKPLSINGSKDTITKIVISPMSVCAYVKGDDIMTSVRPVVKFKDGSQVTYDKNSKNKAFVYYLIDQDNMIYLNQLYYRFENIINVDDVQSITIGNVTISIR